MTLHPRTGWGNRTFPSVHWRLVFQGQEMDNIVWPGQYFTHQLHHFIRKKKHFGRSPADQGTLSKVHGWIGQWQNSRNRPLQHHCGHITLGWNWVMGDQHGVCETGVLSNQLHKAWEVRRGKAAVPPKTASFRSRAQLCSTAKELFDKYFSGLFFLAQSYQGSLCICLRTHRECKPATFFPFKNQMISCGFNPAKLYQI